MIMVIGFSGYAANARVQASASSRQKKRFIGASSARIISLEVKNREIDDVQENRCDEALRQEEPREGEGQAVQPAGEGERPDQAPPARVQARGEALQGGAEAGVVGRRRGAWRRASRLPGSSRSRTRTSSGNSAWRRFPPCSSSLSR